MPSAMSPAIIRYFTRSASSLLLSFPTCPFNHCINFLKELARNSLLPKCVSEMKAAQIGSLALFRTRLSGAVSYTHLTLPKKA